MAEKVTLNGDYGLEQYRYNGGPAEAIDASDANWTVANTGSNTNLYPFLVDKAKTGIDIYGATIDGTVPQNGEWLKLYTNSAAFMVRDTEQADISDIRITQAWDGVRVAGDSDGFDVSNVWVSDVRDDAFENDNPVSGTIRDSLFEDAFSGISLGHKNMANASGEVLEIDGVLLGMESYLFKGNKTHQSPFKMESKSPKLKITDSVVAIDDVDHIGQQRLEMAWDKSVGSSGNVFLNLSDTPLPNDYPTPPSGWTVLQGDAARDYWSDARADWIANRGGDTQRADPAPEPEETAKPVAEDEPARPTTTEDAEPSGDAVVSPGGRIELDAGTYTSLEVGPLREKNFEVAARADDRDDYVMYKWKTGELFYDEDGRGGADQIKIGQLESRLDLDHTDFAVVGDSAPSDSTAAKAGEDDMIVFDTAPTGGNVETILDFDPATDRFGFDKSAFADLPGRPGGELDAAHFEVAARADDRDDHVMYKWKTGELFYDEDGRGGADQVKVAQMDDRMSLDHDHFMIV